MKKSKRALRLTAIGGNLTSGFIGREVYRFGVEVARASGDVRNYRSMQVVERSAIVTFSASQMFALVDDVGRYPEFLPYCAGARVDEVSATERLASVKVARGLLRTEFTTRNTVTPDEQILMHLVDGPFNKLTGEWRFDAIGDRGSRVQFRVEFEFKNKLTAAALSTAFESFCGSIVDAFVLRAGEIYAHELGT